MGKMDIMDNMDIQILRQAARTQGTPAYVFDLDAFARRIRHMKEVLGQDIKILYAMKANPFLTRPMMKHVDEGQSFLYQDSRPGSGRPGGVLPRRICHMPEGRCAPGENRTLRR